MILHGSSFLARVPQEVEAWYCDWKVCETDTENEHFWTPITTSVVSCITVEEEEKRVKMMGERKNKVMFPDEESRRKSARGQDHAEEEGASVTPSSGDYIGAGDSALFSIFVLIAGSIVIGIPLYIYVKQKNRLGQAMGGQHGSSRKAKVRFRSPNGKRGKESSKL